MYQAENKTRNRKWQNCYWSCDIFREYGSLVLYVSSLAGYRLANLGIFTSLVVSIIPNVLFSCSEMHDI